MFWQPFWKDWIKTSALTNSVGWNVSIVVSGGCSYLHLSWINLSPTQARKKLLLRKVTIFQLVLLIEQPSLFCESFIQSNHRNILIRLLWELWNKQAIIPVELWENRFILMAVSKPLLSCWVSVLGQLLWCVPRKIMHDRWDATNAKPVSKPVFFCVNQ